MAIATPNHTLEDRLKSKLVARDDCIEYGGYICKLTGYGKISNRPGAPIGTHVAMWIVTHGPVPEGLVVRHKCDNRKCVKIEHLELGTLKDNSQDMVKRDRCNKHRLLLEVCPNGHPFDSTDWEGYRSCSICLRHRARIGQIRKRTAKGVCNPSEYCPGCAYLSKRCRCEELALGAFLRKRH